MNNKDLMRDEVILAWLQSHKGGYTAVMVAGTINAEEIAPGGSGMTFSTAEVKESLMRLKEQGRAHCFSEGIKLLWQVV